MKAHKSLRALIDTTLDAIKKIITGVIAVLFTSKNDLKTVCLKLILACRHNLPGKIGLAFAITLRAGVRPAVASVESDYANITRGTCGIGRNAIRRISTLQCLLDSLSLDCISVLICIVNRCALGARRSLNNRE